MKPSVASKSLRRQVRGLHSDTEVGSLRAVFLFAGGFSLGSVATSRRRPGLVEQMRG